MPVRVSRPLEGQPAGWDAPGSSHFHSPLDMLLPANRLQVVARPAGRCGLSLFLQQGRHDAHQTSLFVTRKGLQIGEMLLDCLQQLGNGKFWVLCHGMCFLLFQLKN
ncbi:MAG TPA: hypothetical protein VFB60_02355 [Ktedonobacteraceae bacterium]|nr:hypothetical protein [Ktedonobacteraceae bacterium]